MEVEFFDIRWHDTGSVELQVQNKEKFGRKQYKIGDTISFEVVRENLECVGILIDGVWQPCQYNSHGYSRCKSCKAREGSFVYTMFDGFNTDLFNEDDLIKIAGPHVVYLALFDQDTFKVGVSGLARKELRQVEQGSFATLYVAQTENGTQARQIETLIGKSGIKDKIKSSQKKESIVPQISPDEARKNLEEIAETISEILKEYPKLKNLLLAPFEYKLWDKVYGIDLLKEEDQRLHAINLNEGDSISGTIRALRGPFLVIDTGEELISICMKDYIGKKLSFIAKSPGLYTKQAFQNSLF